MLGRSHSYWLVWITQPPMLSGSCNHPCWDWVECCDCHHAHTHLSKTTLPPMLGRSHSYWLVWIAQPPMRSGSCNHPCWDWVECCDLRHAQDGTWRWRDDSREPLCHCTTTPRPNCTIHQHSITVCARRVCLGHSACLHSIVITLSANLPLLVRVKETFGGNKYVWYVA